jgi:hypothetical protein
VGGSDNYLAAKTLGSFDLAEISFQRETQHFPRSREFPDQRLFPYISAVPMLADIEGVRLESFTVEAAVWNEHACCP